MCTLRDSRDITAAYGMFNYISNAGKLFGRIVNIA